MVLYLILLQKVIDNIKNIIYYEYINNTLYYWFNNNIIYISKKFIFKNFNTYVYKYNFINTFINNSLIHNEYLEYHYISSINEYNIILNNINNL